MGETPGDADIVENIIIGSGLAAFATAMALKARGSSSTVIDVGYDLEPGKEEDVARLAEESPGDWDQRTLGRLYPPPAASSKGVERRLLFGSDFPYRIPSCLSVRMEDCGTELSHGLGGFGNVWGAAMLPYSAAALRDWPVPARELDQSYRNVLKYVPISAEEDGLAASFPVRTENAKPLDRSRRIDVLLECPRSAPGEPVEGGRGVRPSACRRRRRAVPLVRTMPGRLRVWRHFQSAPAVG